MKPKHKTAHLTHKNHLRDFGKFKEKSKMFDLATATLANSRTMVAITKYINIKKKKNLKRSREQNRPRSAVILTELGRRVTDLRLAVTVRDGG